MKTASITIGAVLAALLLVACTHRSQLPVPEKGATWVSVNNYMVPSSDALPDPAPSYRMPPAAKPCADRGIDTDNGKGRTIQPIVYPGMDEVPECVGEDCLVPMGDDAHASAGDNMGRALAKSGTDNLAIFFGVIALFSLGFALVTKTRGPLVVVAGAALLILCGCSALGDAGDAIEGALYDATGVPSNGDIPTDLPGDGSGLGVLEAILYAILGGSPIAVLLVRLLRGSSLRSGSGEAKDEEVEVAE